LRAADDLIPVIRDTLINESKQVVTNDAGEPQLTVVDMIQDWLATTAKSEVRQSTFATYSMYVKNRIIPFFNENYPNLAAIDNTHKIMQEFATQMKREGLKVNSIRKYLVPIRDAYSFGFDEEIISRNPVGDYKYSPKRKTLEEKAQEKTTKRRALTKEECKELMEAVKNNINLPICVPIVLALHCGLRREEILGLRFSDIDFRKRTVTIKNTVTKIYVVVEEEKTKSVAGMRTLPLDDYTFEFLLNLRSRYKQNSLKLGAEYEDNGYVYVRDDGKRYYPDSPTSQLKKFLKRNNLNKVTLHELRHTYCTMLIAAGVDPKTVQYLMGHEDTRMTVDLYSHPVKEKIFSSVSAVSSFLVQ
jgi:integrase